MLEKLKEVLKIDFSASATSHLIQDQPNFRTNELDLSSFGANVVRLRDGQTLTEDKNTYPYDHEINRSRLISQPQVIDTLSEEMFAKVFSHRNPIEDVVMSDGTVITVEQIEQMAEAFIDNVLIPSIEKK